VRARRKVTRLVIDPAGFNNRSLGEIREAGSGAKRDTEGEEEREKGTRERWTQGTRRKCTDKKATRGRADPRRRKPARQEDVTLRLLDSGVECHHREEHHDRSPQRFTRARLGLDGQSLKSGRARDKDGSKRAPPVPLSLVWVVEKRG